MNNIGKTMLALVALAHSVSAADSGATSSKSAGPSIATAADIAFGPDGAVSSLVLEQGGDNLVDRSNPGRGFYLETWTSFGLKQFRLDRIQRQGATLILGRKIEGGNMALPRFTFELTSNPRYLALKLKRVEGLPANQMSLRLEIRCRAGVAIHDLGCMVSSRAWTEDRNRGISGEWNHLWHRNPKEALGGFSMFPAGDPDKEDEALLEAWVNEDLLPRPAIKEPWTKERARRWLEEFGRLYGDQTQMIVAAQSPQELHAMTEVAERAGVKQVYLHTDTWRGEYWPVTQSHVYINPKVFPNGLKDLKDYADYLRQRGMFLVLHTTSAGIGPRDPKRIAGHVSRDLATWGAGLLEEPLTSTARTIRFRPVHGTAFPFFGSWVEGQRGNIPSFFNPAFVRIGEEIVSVGAFEDTDQPVWTLTGCNRGIGATNAADHSKGDEAAALLSGYGQNFVPDLDSPLLEEMAQEYADLANAIGLGRLEYDALEINCYPQWGGKKYPELVARRLDHSVITNTSGGTFVPSNIELKFNRYKHLAPGVNAAHTSFITENGYRRATPEIEFNTSLASGIARGATKLGISKSQAMFGINQAMLAEHGLSGQFLDNFRRWHAVARLATSEQRKAMEKALASPPAGKRTLIAPVFARGFMGAGIRETRDAYEVIPTRFLTRPTDAPAMVGVESATQSPRQFIRPGESLLFNNPYAAQPLTWTIRVLAETGTSSNESRSPASEERPAIVDQYLTGVKSALAGAVALQPSSKPAGQVAQTRVAVALQPKAAEVQNQRHAVFSQDGTGVVVSAENLHNEDLWQEDDLPNWGRAAAMPGHGLSLDVTGDGSGAVLVIQLSAGGSRDYIVKVDFTGKRTVVIPCGEVSWADGRWGRRPGTERCKYDRVNGVAMGFGYIPAKTSPRVKVENLQVLADCPIKLVNPVIVVGAGELRIDGQIESGQYLRFAGGDTAGVYDENWHLLKQLPVKRRSYLMPSGPAQVSVRVADGAPRPWLEAQFFAEGEPIQIPKEARVSDAIRLR